MSTQKKKQTPIEKVAALIVDKRKAFYLFYIIAGIFCAVATGWVQVNNDITSYLPDSSETRTGLTIMNDQFVTYGTGSIMLDNITLESAQKVAEDLEKIDGETSVMLTLPDNSAIIAEYKENGLNLQKAIETVRNRKAAEEAEKNRIEEITQRNADETKRAESVQKAAEPYFEAPSTVTPETKEIPAEQPEKRYTMKFNVRGTMEQLKSLKRYIESAGIEIIE